MCLGLADCIHYFPEGLRYVVADGFYSKYKWVTGVVQLDFQAIGKLRCDANLKFLYDGSYQGRGARRILDLFIDLFELEPTLIKFYANYRMLLDYGAIAS